MYNYTTALVELPWGRRLWGKVIDGFLRKASGCGHLISPPVFDKTMLPSSGKAMKERVRGVGKVIM